MKYRKAGDRYVVRIDRGEEVVTELLRLAEAEQIGCASIVGLGAADRVTVGLYNVETKQFEKTTFTEPLEVSSIIGNFSRKDGKAYQHIHVTVCNTAMQAFGGHLVECRISGTAELFVTVLDMELGRVFDEETGLNLFHFA